MAGYVLAVAVFAIFLAAVLLILRVTVFRRGRIFPAGWAPWWYVGGQPDVPRELQEPKRRRRRR